MSSQALDSPDTAVAKGGFSASADILTNLRESGVDESDFIKVSES
ncbi:MAG: hypothetical protein RJB13_673 [Pseudomonadota bacterium]|jgi:hypothetical protein